MENYIIIAVTAIIVTLASVYIYKAKKKGQKCIGCPYSSACRKQNTEHSEICGCCNDK